MVAAKKTTKIVPVEDVSPKPGFVITGKTYDTLNWLVRVVMPALGALYFTLSQTWGFDYGTEVVGTDAALTAFLGLVLQASARNYKNSDLDVDGTVPADSFHPSLAGKKLVIRVGE